MTATGRTVQPTTELMAFAGNGWAFREAVRAPARALVLATLLQAMAGARTRGGGSTHTHFGGGIERRHIAIIDGHHGGNGGERDWWYIVHASLE